MTRLVIASITVALALASAQATRKGGPPAVQNMMSKTLTDADIDKYCAIAAEIRKLTGPMRSGVDSDRMFEIAKTTAPKHGLSHADYRALDLRISSALLAIDAGKQNSIPRLKADCDLVARHRARLESARAFPSNAPQPELRWLREVYFHSASNEVRSRAPIAICGSLRFEEGIPVKKKSIEVLACASNWTGLTCPRLKIVMTNVSDLEGHREGVYRLFGLPNPPAFATGTKVGTGYQDAAYGAGCIVEEISQRTQRSRTAARRAATGKRLVTR